MEQYKDRNGFKMEFVCRGDCRAGIDYRRFGEFVLKGGLTNVIDRWDTLETGVQSINKFLL